MRAHRFVAVLCLVAFAASARAAVEPLRDSGDWRLSAVGARIACTLTFTRTSSFAGFELKAPLACRRAFPPLRSVAAWTVDEKGGIVLSDANAQPIVTFPAEGKLPFETRAPDGRTWRLEPVRPTSGPPASDEMPIVTAPGGI